MAGLSLIVGALVAATAVAADGADQRQPPRRGRAERPHRAATVGRIARPVVAAFRPRCGQSRARWRGSVGAPGGNAAGGQRGNQANIYADDGAGMLSPAVRGVPYRIYVPNSGGSRVTVIDPSTYRVIESYQTGLNHAAMSCPATTCAPCMR